MTEALDPKPLLDAAQEAAAAGDYAEAERLLRDAVAIQEVSLGPLHPELASTLNNLALVCEHTNKVDEAERGYRRAHAIAVASLSPGHPFIATSLENLVDFCAAHQIPIWKSSASRSDDMPPPVEPEALPAHPMPAPPPGRPWPARTIALTVLAAAVVAAVAFAVRNRGGTDAPDPLLQAQNVSSANESAAAPPTASAAVPEPGPTGTREKPIATPVAAAPTRAEGSVTSPTVSVLAARLCAALERRGSPDWECVPVDGDSKPGTYIFYTRLLTNVDTTVEHRWYRGDRAHQVTKLRVSAAPGRGYRTFSSSTITPERAGEWKVELRGADGTVLRQERFAVR
jgi:hypothetical protein